MQKESQSTIPVTLIAGVRSHMRGLRIIELERFRGRNSYQPVGHRWSLTTDGEPTPHDAEPDDDADAIAAELYAAACEARGSEGDPKFRALFFSMTKMSELEKHEARFTVSGENDSGPDASPEAQTRADILEEMRRYIALMHNMNIAQWKSIGGIFDSVAAVIQAPAAMLPRILDLRMEAFEDRAAAMGLVEQTVAQSASSEKWKESAAELKQFMSGPLGRAATGRMLGLEGEELRSFVGLDEQAPGNAGGIRGMLLQLASTLTEKQKESLRSKVGAKRVELLVTAATAPDENAAAGCVAKFFGEVDDAGLFDSLQAELTDEQQAVIVRVMDALEAHTDDKKR